MFVKYFEDEEHYVSPQCINASSSDITTVSHKNLLMKINTHWKYALGVYIPSITQQRSWAWLPEQHSAANPVLKPAFGLSPYLCRAAGARGLSAPAGALPYFGHNIFPPKPWILTSGLFAVPAGLSRRFLTIAAAHQPQPWCGAVQHPRPRQSVARQRVRRDARPPPAASLRVLQSCACASRPLAGPRTCHAVCHGLSPPFQRQRWCSAFGPRGSRQFLLTLADLVPETGCCLVFNWMAVPSIRYL